MILKVVLSTGEAEFNWHASLDEGLENLVYRNTAAGRQVEVRERTDRLVQFTLIYPSINRRVEGTLSKAMVRRNSIDISEAEPYIPQFQKLKKKKLSTTEICRRMGITVTMATHIARAIKELKKK